MKANRAFTLVELLTVIAVISILAALLLSALHRVKQSAGKAVCVSNQQQIGLAMNRNTNVWGCPQNRNIKRYIMEYYHQREGDVTAEQLLKNWNFSYGLNAWGIDIWKQRDRRSYGMSVPGFPLIGEHPLGNWNAANSSRMASSIQSSQIAQPSNMIALGNHVLYRRTSNNARSITFPGHSSPRAWAIFNSFHWNSTTRRHNGKANILFADGHIAAETPKQLGYPAEVSWKRWNYDHKNTGTTETCQIPKYGHFPPLGMKQDFD